MGGGGAPRVGVGWSEGFVHSKASNYTVAEQGEFKVMQRITAAAVAAAKVCMQQCPQDRQTLETQRQVY